MSEDVISVRLRLQQGALFAAELHKASAEVKKFGNEVEKADRKSKSASSSFALVQKTLKLIKPAAIITGIGLLSQVISATAAGGIGLTSALTPLVGLLGTLPALGILVGQGMGVAALGLTGVTAAVGGLNDQIDPKKFALLQRPAQDFVLALDRMKQPVLALQRAVQGGLLPGLTAGLQAAMPAVKALTAPLTATARVLGLFAARLGALVGSQGFLTDLRDQAYFSNIQLTRLGDGALHVVNGLRNLMVTSRPLVSSMVQLVTGWAASADQAIVLGRATGGLARFFHSTEVAVFRVVRIGADLGVTLMNIGRIGKQQLGDSLLISLVRGANALRQWSQSSRGIGQITNYFRQARPVVYAVGKLFHDIAVDFLGLGAGGPGLAGLIDQFRTQLLPVLVSVMQSTTAAFGPHLIAAITAIGKAFAPIAGSSGPLALYVQGLTAIANGVFWLEQHVPFATQILSAFVATMVIGKVLGITKALGGLAAVVTDLSAAEVAQLGFIGRLKAIWATYKAWRIAQAAKTGTEAGLAEGESLQLSLFSETAATKYAAAGSTLGTRFGAAFRTAGLVGIGVLADDILKKTGALGQYSGKKGWGELLKDSKHDLGKIGGLLGGMAHKALPGAASGGLISTAGSFMIGEQGPELWTMLPGMRAARVDPLPAMGGPRMSSVSAPSGGSGGRQPTVVNLRSVLQLPDGRVIAEAADQVVADDTARA